MLSRRTAIRKMLRAAAGLAVARDGKVLAQARDALPLRLSGGAPVAVPENFTGLGYEMSSVATTNLLSPANRRYVELVRGLGRQGVLRVGGNVANYTRYFPDGTARNERQNTLITRACLEDFAGFLWETGWSVIWSVNFAQGTIEEGVKEARAAFDVFGPRLLAIEIGNEVEHLRKRTAVSAG